MSPFDTQRLTPLALDEAASKVPQTIMPGGGLTKGQIDALQLSRLTAWLARLFH